MMYHRGTLADFTTWHDAAKIAEGIMNEGRVGAVRGVPAPQNQRTTSYAIAIPHPSNTDDYIWYHGEYPDAAKPILSQEDAVAAGWKFATE